MKEHLTQRWQERDGVKGARGEWGKGVKRARGKWGKREEHTCKGREKTDVDEKERVYLHVQQPWKTLMTFTGVCHPER